MGGSGGVRAPSAPSAFWLRGQSGQSPRAPRFWAVLVPPRCELRQAPSGCGHDPHFSTDRLPLGRGSGIDGGWSFQPAHLPPHEVGASAADGAHGPLQGAAHARRPTGEALLARCLLGCALGGPGGIGPDGDVIPAPLEGESQSPRLEGVKGRGQGAGPAQHAHVTGSPGPSGHPLQLAHPDAVVPALPRGLQRLHACAVTHGSPAEAVAPLDFAGDDPDLEHRPAAGPALAVVALGGRQWGDQSRNPRPLSPRPKWAAALCALGTQTWSRGPTDTRRTLLDTCSQLEPCG